MAHGRNGIVRFGIGNVGRVTAFSYDESESPTEETAMGDSSKVFEAGLVEGSGTIDFRFDQNDGRQDSGMSDLRDGDSVSLVLYPLGLTGGVSFTGSVIINSFTYTQSFDDTINGSFGFQGVLTKS